MLKFIAAVLATVFAASAFAAVDVNKATQAELESIRGIGTSMSGRMMEARSKGAFRDWADLRQRVKGVGERNAQKLSAQGLTVNGAPYPAAAAGPTAVVSDAGKGEASSSNKGRKASGAVGDGQAKAGANTVAPAGKAAMASTTTTTGQPGKAPTKAEPK